YSSRVNAYYNQGNYTQSIAYFNHALNLKPDYADAYIGRGSAYYNQGNYTQAIADYNQALKLKPDDAGAYYNKACAYSLKKEVKEAIENLKRAIQLDVNLRENAKTDSDFNNIRQDKQFQALVGK
ncbi:MAG: tetratricopeptide repeat protein, partial [Cyanobacteria bacterium CAN_BIN43]|nr:tetratricopeptide repeat protein [Cyanobacteria bacterium CAN_BIN43]